MKERKPYEFHEIASIFPLLPEPELKSLADDIKAKGLQNDIVLYEGKILDGRNRYRACLAANVQPTFTHYAAADPIGFVISLNSRRRHMTASDLAVAAAKSEELRERYAAEARERMSERKGNQPGTSVEIFPHLETCRSTDKLGKQLGVSGRYIRDAIWLKGKHPEEFKKVECGSKSVGAAMDHVRKRYQANPPEPTPESPSKLPPLPKYIPAKGLMIWSGVKGMLDHILPIDKHREEALDLCIKYCENRKSKGI